MSPRDGHYGCKSKSLVELDQEQVLLSEQPQATADVALLGLGPMMLAIVKATEDLAGAVTQVRADLSLSKQRKALVAKYSQVFGTVY